MALTDFFRINLPYGIVRDSKGRWSAFNREYLPLGWNEREDSPVDINSDNVSITNYLSELSLLNGRKVMT